jgi:ferrous iron transport protein A
MTTRLGDQNSTQATVSTLADLGPGETAVVQRIDADSLFIRRLSALGLVRGTQVLVEATAPLGDPRAYSLLGYQLSLRNQDARRIVLQPRT